MDFKNLKESRKIEFKSSFGKEVIITLVAFANTRGGKVILGLDNKGKVKGIELGPRLNKNTSMTSRHLPILSFFPILIFMKLMAKPYWCLR